MLSSSSGGPAHCTRLAATARRGTAVTRIHIDIRRLGAKTHGDDRVILYAPAAVTGPVTRTVDLVDGQTIVHDVEPGMILIRFRCRGIADGSERHGTVPAAGEVTLEEVLGIRATPGQAPVPAAVAPALPYAVEPGGLSDHTRMLQETALACAAAGGGVLRLMPGTYTLHSTLELPEGVSLEGSGEYVSTIHAPALAAGTPAIWVPPGATGTSLSGFRLLGSGARACDGIRIGNYGESTGGVSDFTLTSIRVEAFNDGILAEYAWCGSFRNVRVHSCVTGLRFGSQANAIDFNGWITSFTGDGAVLVNAEGINFQTTSFESPVATGSALTLFQSQVTMTQPYIEFISTLAQLGSGNEVEENASSLVITGGRVCGRVNLGGRNCQLSIISPWLISSGNGTPLSIDTDGGTFSNSPRQIRVDNFSTPAEGLKIISRWDARGGEWGLPQAYGGAGVRAVAGDDHYRVTSPHGGQGIRIGDLEAGQQYVFSYRARKTEGTLSLKEGERASDSIAKVEDARADFTVVHIPFIAGDTTLRLLWAGELDLQWFALSRGLNFLDRR